MGGRLGRVGQCFKMQCLCGFQQLDRGGTGYGTGGGTAGTAYEMPVFMPIPTDLVGR